MTVQELTRDQSQYYNALARWDRHHEAGNYSVPSEVGKLAVVLSYDLDRDKSAETLDPYTVFIREAMTIAERAHQGGKPTELVLNASRNDFRSVLREPTITDIVVLGNGCLSSVAIDPLTGHRRVDWQNIARMSDHLKTGTFIQRFCGLTPRELNVPLGLMAVSKHSDVYAPVGRYFRPNCLDSRENRHIKPVTELGRMSVEDVEKHFPKRQSLPLSQKPRRAVDKLRVLRRAVSG